MRLNHINVPVCDVPTSRGFLEKYFGFRCIVEKGAETFVALVDEGGTILALGNFDGVEAVDYPKWFHVGFMQRDDATVDAIHRRLTADGIEVGERENMHGAWTFYFTAPGGFDVEVSHQRDL